LTAAPNDKCPLCGKQSADPLFHLRTHHGIRDAGEFKIRVEERARLDARAEEYKLFLRGLNAEREANRITIEEYRTRRAAWEAAHLELRNRT
jgi:hypothetical protein